MLSHRNEYIFYLVSIQICQKYPWSFCYIWDKRGYGCAVVTHSPPTSEVGGSNHGLYVGSLVVAYHWSAVYSTEP